MNNVDSDKFYWGQNRGTVALETAFQIALRNYSKEVEHTEVREKHVRF